MLKIFQKINIENFKNVIIGIFKRMPLSALISIAAFIILIVLIRVEDFSQVVENNLSKVFVTLIVTFFLSIAMYLYTESRQIMNYRRCPYQMLAIAFAILFFYFFEENLFSNMQAETLVYIALSILGVLAFLFISSFIYKFRVKIESQDNFYVATYALVLKSIMSIIVGIVTMILGFIAIGSVFTLFDIKSITEDNWYGYFMAFSVVLFAPMFFLANLPLFNETAKINIDEVRSNKFFSFLINYVGLPAIFIYFFILYAYTVKVLINFSEWPQGEVTWMVILFSFFGYLIYFASYAFVGSFKQANIFRKILPIAVLLQTPMLFYAIGLRINQYDITINRYLVVVFGLWLFGLSIYYIISKRKDLSVLFYSLLIVVILMSIGPWSVYVVPEWRQQNRLVEKLQEAGIRQTDGSIKPLQKYKDIDAGLSGEIYGGIEYLCNYHGCQTLDKIFSLEIDEIKKNEKAKWELDKQERIKDAEKKGEGDNEWVKDLKEEEYSEIGTWTLMNKLTEKIKVERWNNFETNENEEPKYLRFENELEYNYNASIDVSGYDYFAQLTSDGNIKEIIPDASNKKINESVAANFKAVMDTDAGELKLYKGKVVIETINIRETIMKPILENENNHIEPTQRDASLRALLSNDNMTFNLSGEKYDYKIVLRSIVIKNPNWTEVKDKETDKETEMKSMTGYDSSYVDGYVLIKM